MIHFNIWLTTIIVSVKKMNTNDKLIQNAHTLVIKAERERET